MANKWFETVAEAQRRAKKRLPKSVYGALIAGSERGLTLEDNITAYSELGFAPHVAGLAQSRDLTTKVMGQEISFPVLISPPASKPSTRAARSPWPLPLPPAAPPWA
jgi:L-lactate dehydrogenase (cytochrome)/glycolate oxidase